MKRGAEARAAVVAGALSQAGHGAMLMGQVTPCWGRAEGCGQGPQTAARYHCRGGEWRTEI